MATVDLNATDSVEALRYTSVRIEDSLGACAADALPHLRMLCKERYGVQNTMGEK